MFNNLKLSDKGRDLIIKFEGKRNEVYLDSAGLKTIGIGHLIKDSENFSQKLTDDEVYALFNKDISIFEGAVNNLVKVKLNQNQFDALVSFSFNVGVNAFAQSTLLIMLNAGNYLGASNQFPRWNKAGGKVIQGLTNRRLAEQALFNESYFEVVNDFSGHWAKDNIQWALDNGILSDPKKTRPDDKITRAEVITMLRSLVKSSALE